MSWFLSSYIGSQLELHLLMMWDLAIQCRRRKPWHSVELVLVLVSGCIFITRNCSPIKVWQYLVGNFSAVAKQVLCFDHNFGYLYSGVKDITVDLGFWGYFLSCIISNFEGYQWSQFVPKLTIRVHIKPKRDFLRFIWVGSLYGL